MPTVTLTFDIPEEHAEMCRTVHAGVAWNAVDEIRVLVNTAEDSDWSAQMLIAGIRNILANAVVDVE